MSPFRSSPFRAWAVLAALVAVPVLASAASIDDAGARVVVPLFIIDKGFTSSAFVTNVEPYPVKVQLFYVGERYGPVPGMRNCGTFVLPASQQIPLPLGPCHLPLVSGAGMVVLIESHPGIARISARARIDSLSPTTGAILGTMAVTGLPLGALDTTENLHVVQGLRWKGAAAVGNADTTDCFVGAFFDGSGFAGMVGRLDLKDAQGQLLGSRLFNLRPFEFLALRDVFTLVGASGGPYEGVRAEIVWTGGGDAVTGSCVSSREGAVKDDFTRVFEPALVAEPNDAVRTRRLVASSTPALGPFVLAPPLPFTHPREAHGVYVRHPDRITCDVISADPNAPMVITAVSPDGTQLGGSSSTTPEFGNVPRGTVAGGVADLWGLEIEWPPGASTFLQTRYRIDCRSGNGMSLADRLF